MARRKSTEKKRAGKLPGEAQELLDLVVGYAKQETIDPVRSLGRFVGYGLAGALLGSIGAILLLLGGLRLLQTETGDAFDGNLTFIPYFLVLFASAIIVVGAMKARGRGQKREGT